MYVLLYYIGVCTAIIKPSICLENQPRVQNENVCMRECFLFMFIVVGGSLASIVANLTELVLVKLFVSQERSILASGKWLDTQPKR